MDPRQFSHPLSRTMDVLYRFEVKPRSLRGQCIDVVSGLALKALWVEFAAQMEASGGKNASFLMRSIEDDLKSWSEFLILDLRFQILETTAKLVNAKASSYPRSIGQQNLVALTKT